MTLHTIIFVLFLWNTSSFKAQKQPVKCDIDYFYLTEYPGEKPEYHTEYHLDPEYKNAYIPDSKRFFDSLKVVSLEIAVTAACKVLKRQISIVHLYYSKIDHTKSYWEIEGSMVNWPYSKAPKKYKKEQRKKIASMIGVREVVTIDATNGEIKKVFERSFQFVPHF
jgi:hypothetical protein